MFKLASKYAEEKKMLLGRQFTTHYVIRIFFFLFRQLVPFNRLTSNEKKGEVCRDKFYGRLCFFLTRFLWYVPVFTHFSRFFFSFFLVG